MHFYVYLHHCTLSIILVWLHDKGQVGYLVWKKVWEMEVWCQSVSRDCLKEPCLMWKGIKHSMTASNIALHHREMKDRHPNSSFITNIPFDVIEKRAQYPQARGALASQPAKCQCQHNKKPMFLLPCHPLKQKMLSKITAKDQRTSDPTENLFGLSSEVYWQQERLPMHGNFYFINIMVSLFYHWTVVTVVREVCLKLTFHKHNIVHPGNFILNIMVFVFVPPFNCDDSAICRVLWSRNIAFTNILGLWKCWLSGLA